MITLNVGFEKQEDDKVFNFEFDATQKIAIEKGITHFLTFSGEADGWVFVNWKSETMSGTLFNPAERS